VSKPYGHAGAELPSLPVPGSTSPEPMGLKKGRSGYCVLTKCILGLQAKGLSARTH
jgi:hypothetical protein